MPATRTRKPKDTIGQVFGKLLVMRVATREEVFKKHNGMTKCRSSHWFCQCECGKTKVACRGSLVKLRGGIKSCGCLPHNPHATPGRAAFTFIYSNYLYSAKRRGLEFSLTMEEFREIIGRDCYYCGSEPIAKYLPRHRRLGHYIANGIDRKDNSIGYIVSNCLPCCKSCNISKNNRTYEEFINWILCAATHLKHYTVTAPSN